MKRMTLAVVLAVSLVSCTTYHASGLSGGFTETQLSDMSYEVRFQGNGYTSADRVQQFLLRRAAELTLEHGYRYFVVGDQRGNSPTWGMTFHNSSGTVRFLRSADENANAADAVTVIHATDGAAGGRLSEKAREQLQKFGA